MPTLSTCLFICLNKNTKDFEFIFNSIQISIEKLNKDLLKPTALISDATGSMKIGFRNVFNNEYNQIMCWVHIQVEGYSPSYGRDSGRRDTDRHSMKTDPYTTLR